jgi:hypothetical protein
MDNFYNTPFCERCDSALNLGRTMSWFNSQVICSLCSIEEKEIKSKLPNSGSNHEGCGFIPDIKEE